MKVEIKDKSKEIVMALSGLGYNVDSITVEIMLNVVDFIRDKKGDVTIKEVAEIKEMVKDLYKE